MIGRAQRRDARRPAVLEAFGPRLTNAALDLLELTEFAWHDCYGQTTPPDDVIADILVVAGGDLHAMVGAARLAVMDARDLRLAADSVRRPDLDDPEGLL